MDDAAAAKKLITGLRKRRRVDNDDRDSDDDESINQSDLQGALAVISQEIYNDPAHFIHELVQNADDNIYPEKVDPRLTFVHRELKEGGYLFVGCNEEGFTEKHVRAICRVRHSSKPKSTGEHTGEKGIGFKSVFSVASKVWIKSRALEFRFDRDEPLGMISPIWCPRDFPSGSALDDTTMLALYIPGDGDFDRVRAELESLSYEVILFLRKINLIEVWEGAANRQHQATKRLLRQQTQEKGYRHVWTIKSEKRTVDYNFIVTDRTAEEMPQLSARQSRSSSQLSIAFPIDSNGHAIANEQRTFCFLPIERSFGLSFILQSEFITSANRGDIVKNNEWNRRLIDEALGLFLDSVDMFNDRDVLKTTWPRYLAFRKQPHDSVFEEFQSKLLQTLKSRLVLASRNNSQKLVSPSKAMILPTAFTAGDKDGTPLLPTGNKDRKYVSGIYNPVDLKQFKLPQMDNSTFFQSFMDFVKEHTAKYHQKPATWHSMVANILVDSLNSYKSRTRSSSVKKLKDLPIFLLRSGTWISADHRGHTLYIPKTAHGVHLPAGITADVLDDIAAKDQHLHRLYSLLDARELDSAEIQSMIVEHHRSKDASRSWDSQTVILHARFLFQQSVSSGRGSRGTIPLLMATSKDELAVSNELYIDLPHKKTRLRKLFDACRDVAFVDDAYLDQSFPSDPDGKAWFDWLEEVLEVKTLPDIFASNGKLSKAFDWLTHNYTAGEWLGFIIDNWKRYGEQFLYDGRSTERLRQIKVATTKHGSQCPLADTYMPTGACCRPQFAKSYVTYVDLDTDKKTSDRNWEKMSCVLNTSPDAKFCLQILKGMRHDDTTNLTVDDVEKIYELLHESLRSSERTRDSEADIKMVKDTFTKENLVFDLLDGNREWISPSKCRWSCYECLEPWYTPLCDTYPDLWDFFHDVLGIRDANIDDIIETLHELDGDEESISDIKALLCAPTKEEWHGADTTLLDPGFWASMKVFPVKRHRQSLRAIAEDDWFIPDRTRYRILFSGKIRILDLDLRIIDSMMPLITALRLEYRLLSRVVVETRGISGNCKLEPGPTDQLQGKAGYISLLVDEDRRHIVITQIRRLEIWSAIAVYAEPVVGKVHGERHSIPVWLDSAQDRLYIEQKALVKHAMPVPLVAQNLADFLDISSKGSNVLLLATILTMKRAKDVEDVMENAGHITDELRATALEEAMEDSDSEPDLDDSESVAATPSPRTPSPLARRKSPAIRISGSESPKYESEGDPFFSPPARKMSPNIAVPSPVDYEKVKQAAEIWKISSLKCMIGPDIRKDLPEMDVSASEVAEDVLRNVLDDEDKLDLSQGALEDSITREIGFGGELFVFMLFQRLFSMQKTEWTSKLRTKAGLDKFGPEKEYSDFTWKTGYGENALPGWISRNGYPEAKRWVGKGYTYHIEVKTTLSSTNEPPTMSGNQMRLARQWHESLQEIRGAKHVGMLVRIYDLMGTPKMCIYIDPFGLMREGALLFSASRIVPL